MPERVPFAEAFRFWLKLGFINFGGPAGQIAIMHREIVEQKQWIGEEQFVLILAIYFAGKVFFAPGSIDYFAVALASLSFVLLLRARIPMYVLVPAAALAGLAWKIFLPHI